MQVNVTNTNGVLQELQAQRNEALNRAAQMAGGNAELRSALEAAEKRIKELEAELAKLKAAPENAVPPVAEAA